MSLPASSKYSRWAQVTSLSTLELDPSLPSRIKAVTSMGGAAQICGNASAVGKLDIWNDPGAAKILLQLESDSRRFRCHFAERP